MKYEEKVFLMEVARLTAKRSTGVRAKVGSVVADSVGNLIAVGYNGGIRGGKNDLEKKIYAVDEGQPNIITDGYPYAEWDYGEGNVYRLVTDENITIHAEHNLIAHAARRGISINGGVVFNTLSPCHKCTALLIQSGVQEIIFDEVYRTHDQVEEEYGKYIRLTKWSDVC